jgi:hypothetical protein
MQALDRLNQTIADLNDDEFIAKCDIDRDLYKRVLSARVMLHAEKVVEAASQYDE